MTIKVEIGIEDRNQLVVIEFTQKAEIYGLPDKVIGWAYDKEELSALISQLEQAYDQLK